MVSSPGPLAYWILIPSRIILLSTFTCANCRRVLSKPISWATLLPNLICVASSSACLSASGRYFSRKAEMKLCGLSAGRVGRTNEAAVGRLDRPKSGQNVPSHDLTLFTYMRSTVFPCETHRVCRGFRHPTLPQAKCRWCLSPRPHIAPCKAHHCRISAVLRIAAQPCLVTSRCRTWSNAPVATFECQNMSLRRWSEERGAMRKILGAICRSLRPRLQAPLTCRKAAA